MSQDMRGVQASPLTDALRTCRGAFLATGVFSGIVNVLMLSGSLFMLQVYDRVLPSRSIPTLLVLAALVAGLYLFQGLLEVVRARVLARIGRQLDDHVGLLSYRAMVTSAAGGRSGADHGAPLRDLEQVRGFLAGSGPTALFDLPWMPLYLLLCFLFHFWIGVTALAGAVILVALTIATEFGTRRPTAESTRWQRQQADLAEASRRNAEALRAMGMVERLADRWQRAHLGYLGAQQLATDRAGALGSISRVLRMMLQSAVLAVGAWLVIEQQATAGIMIASSILTSRALAPVELAIAQWRGFQAARQGWKRLSAALMQARPAEHLPLPPPRETLVVENVLVSPPGVQRMVLNDIAFRLERGQGLGVIGPSASGKSSLARVLVGLWRPARGKVRLDGAALEQWEPERLGAHVGYLPQEIDLFDGTVAENIARFDPVADPAAILKAAQAAGVHELVLRLPEGYDSRLGEGGSALSAGQRQRIALARALYGDPFLVVLDEPNANLDTEGEQALTQAIKGVRKRGGIVVVIAHRPAALAGVDLVLALAGGQVQAFGPKEETLRKVLRAASPPLKVVGDAKATPA